MSYALEFGAWKAACRVRWAEAEREHRVYVIRGFSSELLKIGHSINVAKRLRTLQRHAGEQLRLLVTIPGDAGLESRLHEMFAEHRAHGEWFKPAKAVLEFVKTAKRRRFQAEMAAIHNRSVDRQVAPLLSLYEDSLAQLETEKDGRAA